MKKKSANSDQAGSVSEAEALLAAAQSKGRAARRDPESSTHSRSDPWTGSDPSLNQPDTGWTWQRLVLGGAALLLLTLTLLSWGMSPQASSETLLILPDGVPRQLMRAWLQEFPEGQALRQRPDTDTLQAFAAFLAHRNEIAEVRSVRIVPRSVAEGGGVELRLDVQLHQPLLPVLLANGERAWLGREGHLLPGILQGPSGMPIVRGIDFADPQVIEELVAVWPQLQGGLPVNMRNLVREIDAHARLANDHRHGIIFHTHPGTRLVWGHPQEAQYGVCRDKRLRNLIHTLSCQGDLRRVPEINVRFHEPFAVVR